MAINGIPSNTMRFFGMASGLDVDEIVQGLIRAEQGPLNRLQQTKQILLWQQEDLRQINRMLRELRDIAFSLQLQQTFQPRTASSNNESIVTASVSGSVPAGTHTITVHQLADAARFYSGEKISEGDPGSNLAEQFGINPDALEDGKIRFTITNSRANNGQGVSKEFEFEVTTQSIRDVMNAINSSGLELRAVYEPELDRFFLTSLKTGEDVEIAFDDPDNFLQQHLALRDSDGNEIKADGETTYTGKVARFDYNGVTGLTHSSNQFTLGGVTFTLHAADPATPVTVRVSHDVDKVVETIKSFVEKYNEVIRHINLKLSEKRYYDYPPLTEAQRKEMSEEEIKRWEEQARSGLLRGDSLLTRIASRMREALGSQVQAGGALYTTLAGIGITTGDWREQGVLHVDEAKLRAAIAQDAEAVAALFRSDGEEASALGLARRLIAALDAGMEDITNRVGRAGAPVDQSAVGRRLGWIDDAIERTQQRLAQREAQLYRQFTILERFMSQMNAQSLWLMQTFMGGGF